MQKSKTIKIVIIGLVLAAIILGYYYYLSNRNREAKEETVQISTVQNVLMRDLENYYPPTPKEVITYYSEISKCFYNEEYTDEELEQLAFKIMELYDDELIENNPDDDYLQALREDIIGMKTEKYTITGFQVSASTDVDFYTDDGREYASLYCTYNLFQGKQSVSSVEKFVLRKDEDGHWKILGWELADE